jgi:hypothetical protein
LEAIIEKFEVFSCRLNQEASTALSIVEPCNLQCEVQRRTVRGAQPHREVNGIFDVGFDSAPPFTTRLSYRDFRLFMNLWERVWKTKDNLPSVSSKPAVPFSFDTMPTVHAQEALQRLQVFEWLSFVSECCSQVGLIGHGFFQRFVSACANVL